MLPWVVVGGLGAALLIAAGVASLEYTDSNDFCRSCHVMEATVFEEWKESSHYRNASGFRTDCADCHIPDGPVAHVRRKVGAMRFLASWATGTDEPEELLAKRKELAEIVWADMRARDSAECRDCHQMDAMDLEAQTTRARTQHLDAEETGETCIDCHDDGIAHEAVEVEAEEPEGGFRLE